MATRDESSSPVRFSVDASSGSIHDGYSTPMIQLVPHGRRSEETAGYRSTTSMPIEVQQPVSNNMHGTETEVSDLLTRRETVPDDPPPPYRPSDLSHLQAVNMTSVEGPPPPYMYGGLPRQEQFTPQLPHRRQVPLPSAPPLDVIMDDNGTEDTAMLPMTAQEDGVTTNAPLPPSHGHMTLFQNASEDIVLSQGLALDRECELSLYICLSKKDFSTAEPLRIASKTGWTILRHTVFPLLSAYGREALVYTQLATFLSLLAFAIIPMLANSEWTILDVVNVTLTGIATLIATINMAITTCMQRCLLVRRLLCCRRNDDFVVHRLLASMFDLSPIFFSNVLLFLIFICSMFQFLFAFSNANNNWDPTFIASAIFFSLAGFSVLLLMYLPLILIVIFAFRAIQNERAHDDYMSECCGHKSGTALHICFVFHLLVQMALQVLMSYMVGNAFYFGSINGKSISISPALLYLIAGSFIIPLMGVLSFIVPNYYSIRRYPIAFFLNVLQPLVTKSDKMLEAIRIVRRHYIASKRTCLNGYCYSIFHVMLAGFLVAYIILIIAFLVCYMLDPLVGNRANLYELIGSLVAILLGNASVLPVIVCWGFMCCHFCNSRE